MSAPSFIPPVDRPRDDEHEQPVTVMLSPPLSAIVAQLESLRTGFNAQIDAVLAQVHAVAYTGAAINNARGGRTRPAGDNAGMPATFGARPSPRASASPSDAGAQDNANQRQPNVEQRDDERAERAIERL